MTTSTTSILKKLLILFLVFAGLHFAKDFLMPLAIGSVLATLFLPFCRWMEKKLHRGVAALICLFVLLFLIVGIFSLLGWQISELTSDVVLIKQRAIETANRIQQYISNQFGITVEKQWQLLKDQQSSVTGGISFMAGSLASILSGLILIMVYVFGLLYYRGHIKNFFVKLSPSSRQMEMEKVVYMAAKVSQQYLLGLTKMIVCLWIMYGIGFSILGLKNPLFFAFLCGLLEIVPFIGNITGTIITVLIAAVNGANFSVLIGIVGTYGIVQFIQGWLLEPFIVGSQVKINPLFTIIALVIGELVWGIPGIFLAIPLIAMFKIVCDHIESLKPYGFLIGEIESAKAELGFIERVKNRMKRK